MLFLVVALLYLLLWYPPLTSQNCVPILNSRHSPLTLSNRSIESLYEELVEQGIIKKVQNVKMSEFEGEYSYLGTTLRQANIEPMPSLSDVRRVVTEFGVLPLGK